MAKIHFLPLHENKIYEDECADILNEEWPRSKTARLHMLQKSNAKLPYSIVMVQDGSSDKKSTVIGHSRLCMVSGRKDHAFVDSVLVRRSLRGKGYGRMLMSGTEDIANRLEINRLYLTTHDKQDFYSHIGYDYCQPIVTLGGASNLLSNDQVKKLFGGSMGSKNSLDDSNALRNSTTEPPPTGLVRSIQPASAPLPPPPAPPPPLLPPPPPPPPPPQKKTGLKQTSPVRLDPSQVFWMSKNVN